MSYYCEKIALIEAIEIIKENDLNINDKVDYTIGLFHNDKLIGTGSLYQNIIKLVAIKKEHQKENLLSLILTSLINELTKKNYGKYFIFTKQDQAKYFLNLGFSHIITTKGISYLENNNYTIKENLFELYNSLNINSSSTAAILMNCNPITNGHLYLITQAAKNHEYLIVFLVLEDKSFFPYKIREKLVKEATKHLKNVIVVPSTKYLISSSTFPTYFLKQINDASLIEMHFDAKIFIDYFMPIFKINKRYVGSENIDKFTNEYNNVLKSYLKDKLQIIERLKFNDEVISASLVRKYFLNGEFIKIKPLVPLTTYEFLISDEGKKLLK